MCEATPESIARLVRLVLLENWTEMLSVGALNRSGLVWLRSRLAEREFDFPEARACSCR